MSVIEESKIHFDLVSHLNSAPFRLKKSPMMKLADSSVDAKEADDHEEEESKDDTYELLFKNMPSERMANTESPILGGTTDRHVTDMEISPCQNSQSLEMADKSCYMGAGGYGSGYVAGASNTGYPYEEYAFGSSSPDGQQNNAFYVAGASNTGYAHEEYAFGSSSPDGQQNNAFYVAGASNTGYAHEEYAFGSSSSDGQQNNAFYVAGASNTGYAHEEYAFGSSSSDGQQNNAFYVAGASNTGYAHEEYAFGSSSSDGQQNNASVPAGGSNQPGVFKPRTDHSC